MAYEENASWKTQCLNATLNIFVSIIRASDISQLAWKQNYERNHTG